MSIHLLFWTVNGSSLHLGGAWQADIIHKVLIHGVQQQVEAIQDHRRRTQDLYSQHEATVPHMSAMNSVVTVWMALTTEASGIATNVKGLGFRN